MVSKFCCFSYTQEHAPECKKSHAICMSRGTLKKIGQTESVLGLCFGKTGTSDEIVKHVCFLCALHKTIAPIASKLPAK